MFPGTFAVAFRNLSHQAATSQRWQNEWNLKIIISNMHICHLLLGFVCMTTFAFFTNRVGVGPHPTFDTGAISINQMFTITTEDRITTNFKMASAQRYSSIFFVTPLWGLLKSSLVFSIVFFCSLNRRLFFQVVSLPMNPSSIVFMVTRSSAYNYSQVHPL